jgi:hypothetical protein
MEGKPRQYIDDKTPVVVPDSIYYNRLVADGSLIPAPAVIPAQVGIQEEKKGGKK